MTKTHFYCIQHSPYIPAKRHFYCIQHLPYIPAKTILLYTTFTLCSCDQPFPPLEPKISTFLQKPVSTVYNIYPTFLQKIISTVYIIYPTFLQKPVFTTRTHDLLVMWQLLYHKNLLSPAFTLHSSNPANTRFHHSNPWPLHSGKTPLLPYTTFTLHSCKNPISTVYSIYPTFLQKPNSTTYSIYNALLQSPLEPMTSQSRDSDFTTRFYCIQHYLAFLQRPDSTTQTHDSNSCKNQFLLYTSFTLNPGKNPFSPVEPMTS